MRAMNLQNTTDMQRKYFKQNGIINCKQENICPHFIFTPFVNSTKVKVKGEKKVGQVWTGQIFLFLLHVLKVTNLFMGKFL